jgi:3-hydroxy-3-methylglutaryl CoA synthase
LPGIAAFGAYVPRFRLGAETAGWPGSQERAAANFDEDSVTMAVAAGLDCLRGRDRQAIDALFFASSTVPYAEKQGAAIIAAALDLRRDIFAADVTDVLRAGTTALRSALDAVAAGSARQALVVVADSRQGAPRSDTERNSGDGAAAFLVGPTDVAAKFVGSHTLTENMLDNWRSSGDAFVRSWEDRFAAEEGLERIIPDAVEGFLAKYQLGPDDVARVALYAPDARRHARLVRRLGLKPEQVQDPLFGRLGNTGAAFPLMLLASALEEAELGELLLVVSYGDGSDVLAFRTTAPAGKGAPGGGLSAYLESRSVLSDYETYAKWRDVWLTDDAARRPSPSSPSVSALWRESNKNLRLYAGRCNVCGYVQYPPQRVCVNCSAMDDSTPVRLSDLPGELFTYSMDYIAGTVDTPLVVSVVDFQGGGRIICMMTDRGLEEVRIGMSVEMSFRKLRVVNGIHNYYWKAVPRRFAAEATAEQTGGRR